MVKKKLLFVTLYLHTGGVEKSLLALLSELDYKKYDVDLLLFDHSGLLFEMVPKQVNILPPLFRCFSSPLSKAVPQLMKERRFRLLAGKALASAAGKFSKGKGIGFRWTIYRLSVGEIDKCYDVAISYFDFFCNYYVAEKVKAKRKIMYNHQDYAFGIQQGWGSPRLERECFSKSDHIVTVSESARESLAHYFPEFLHKVKVINNISPVETVRRMAEEAGYSDEFKGIRIATVARLGEEKGVWIALEACSELVRQGYDICWYLIGNGPLREKLETKIRELGLDKHFILLGEKLNPYPFMKGCDIYVQPSKTEAHCVAVEEAKLLYRPIVVTDIPSFRKQINDGETGIIIPMNGEGLAYGIRRLVTSIDLRKRLTNNLLSSENRNEIEMKKFLTMIEG